MAGSLAIGRIRIDGIAPSASAERLRATIDRLDAPRLSRAIARALPEGDPTDRRVILLRRVDVLLDGVLVDDADAIAARLGEGILAVIARLISDPARAAVTFASPATRLAAFVAALARGEAWNRWWFADFNGVRLLPVSSALRVALSRDAASGREALGLLPPPDRERVTRLISDIDAALLIEALARELPVGEAAAADWTTLFALPLPPTGLSPAQAVVHELASVLAELDHVPARGLMAAMRLRVRLAAVAEAKAELLAQAIATGSARTIQVLLPDAAPADIASLVLVAEAERQRIATQMRHSDRSTASQISAYSRFGGLLMLWPHLPEVPLSALPAGPGEPSGLLALVALASLAGQADAGWMIDEPVLRAAFGLDPRADRDTLAGWLGEIDATRQAHRATTPSGLYDAALPVPFRKHRRQHRWVIGLGMAAVSEFARRLPGFAGSTLPFLRANLFGGGAQVTVFDGRVQAVLDRPPLDVLLGISGLADREVMLPDGRTLVLERSR